MPPKKAAAKRAANTTAGQPEKAAKAEGATVAAGKAASATPRVAVDGHVPGGTAGSRVYQDDAGANWGVMLHQTDVKNNNNKFYVIQLIEKNGAFGTFTRWGRVGEPGATAYAGAGANVDAAKKGFADKFKDKTKNKWDDVRADASKFIPAAGKYKLIDVDLEDDAADGAIVADGAGAAKKTRASELAPEVQAMLRIIFDKDMFKSQMAEMKLDAKKMPLGKLTKTQIQKGYDALAKLDAAVKAKKSASVLADLSSEFYSTIPHDFGRSVPPAIATDADVAKKFELLNLLSDIQVAVSVDAAAETNDDEHPLDKQYKGLNCALAPVDAASDEFRIIDTYTKETQGYRKCTIEQVYRLDRPEDKQRMQAHAKDGNRHLLWHGTNIAVVAAILKTGLRLMPHSGGRVGRGLYFASENGKSAGYVRADHQTKIGYMFLCEVVMGDTKEINQDDHTLCKEKVDALGVNSILARGRQEPDPSKDTKLKGEWGDMRVPQGKPVPQPQWAKSTFSQSEYLVYEESRVRIKYVLQMRFA